MTRKRQYHKTRKFHTRIASMRSAERNRQIVNMYRDGYTMEEIAEKFELSTQRVSAIWNRYALDYPDELSCCGVEMGEDKICPICGEHWM